MNKGQLPNAVGYRVQLRPVALDRQGRPVDGDWTIAYADRQEVRLNLESYGYTVTLGTDQIYSFLTNPQRDRGGIRFGFLQLLVQLTIVDPNVHIEPIAPPKAPVHDASGHARRFSPLSIEHEGVMRYFSWRGRDPLHLIVVEQEPRRLLSLAGPLCSVLRDQSGMVPQFNLPSDIRGEIIYELSPDYLAKWRVTGGAHDGTGNQVLVLVPPT